jgi:hypothetical protein
MKSVSRIHRLDHEETSCAGQGVQWNRYAFGMQITNQMNVRFCSTISPSILSLSVSVMYENAYSQRPLLGNQLLRKVPIDI